jgi:hypothetical protein
VVGGVEAYRDVFDKPRTPRWFFGE